MFLNLQFLENIQHLIPAGPSLPIVTLSILNLRIPRGGGDQIINLLTLVGPHIIQAYQFTKISLREGLENYFLINVHFTILRETLSISFAGEDDIPLKIPSFVAPK